MSRRPLLLLAASVLQAVASYSLAAEPIDYSRQVKSILKQRCYACHGALTTKANLRLDTGAFIRRGGDGGPAVVPGKHDESLLLDRLTETDPKLRMPPEGSPLTPEQLDAIRGWVDQGAHSPSDETPETDPRKHWAFVPPVRPDVPRVGPGSANPIDAFLERDRIRQGTRAVAPASPHDLIRRVYLDLIGLPPTPAETLEYVSDPTDLNYARIVDRLLASPRHGERWARHWMDVWRYSDWYGRRAVPDVLNSYAQIWRWRDWIVDAINRDRGYDVIVRMMLAADEIAPDDPREVVATGFLVRNFYRWNYNSWMKDNVEHVGKGLLGLTINCAHCHDHKYDPIKNEDYFAFRAFFEPIEIRHDRVEGEPDPGPYPKYDYGKAYGPIKSGLVRVMDEKLDAKTFVYTKGESRNIIPGRPPVGPNVPAFLSPSDFKVKPIDLPPTVAFPGLQPFVRREELSARQSTLAKAESVLRKARETESAAEAKLGTEAARIHPELGSDFAEVWVASLSRAVGLPPSKSLAAAMTASRAARLTLDVEEANAEHAAIDLAALKARIAADDAAANGRSSNLDDLKRTASRLEREAAHWKAKTESARAARAVFADPRNAKARAALAAASAVEAKTKQALKVDSVEYTPLGPRYPTRSTGRRTALANWVARRSNPLTARVAVNHLWRWHFGKPIVASTHDFGRNGSPPTHPELLDWLAVELMESSRGGKPWSMKAIHKLIVTSNAYKMSSHPTDRDVSSLKNDRDNRSYWYFPPRRMEAEEIRDSLLASTGSLDPVMGGPDIDHAQGLTSRRRSLYFTHHGESRMAFLEVFDAADACDAYKRSTSIIPQQALALVNNQMLLELATSAASSIGKIDPSGFIDQAFLRILARPPRTSERKASLSFLEKQAALLRKANDAQRAEELARRDLIHALFSHNDFVTVH